MPRGKRGATKGGEMGRPREIKGGMWEGRIDRRKAIDRTRADTRPRLLHARALVLAVRRVVGRKRDRHDALAAPLAEDCA